KLRKVRGRLAEERVEPSVDFLRNEGAGSLFARIEMARGERLEPANLIGPRAIVGTVEDDRRLGRRPLERRETGDEPAERRHGGKHEHGLAGPEPGPPFNRYRRGARHASLIRSARGTGTGDKTTRTRLLLQA